MTRQATLLVALLFLIAHAAATEQQFASIGDLELLSGEVLEDVRLGYVTAGTLNADKSNIVVFLTWFTGTAKVLIDFNNVGPGGVADTDRYYVVVIDALANGVSTSPSNSKTQAGADFPAIEIGDMVNSQYRLLTEHLGIDHVHAVMGISMGGMQTYDWISRYPDFMDKAVAVDGSPQMTSYDLLVMGAKKRIINVMREDGNTDEEIMSLVEEVGHITLRTPEWFVENVRPDELDEFLAASVSVDFDSFDYEVQQDAMMSLDLLGSTNESAQAWADRVKAEVLILGGAHDLMINVTPSQRAARLLEAWSIINTSECGHLGNVCEADTARAEIHDFLE